MLEKKHLFILNYEYYVNLFIFVFRGDVVYFDGLIETILAVGLVKPKEGKSCLSSQHFFVFLS